MRPNKCIYSVLISIITMVCFVFLAGPAFAGDDDNTFKFYWKDGMRLDSENGQFKLKIGGRIMNDHTLYSADEQIEAALNDGQDIEGATEFRRARLYVAGTIYSRFVFKAQFDFAGGDADFKDMYIGMNKLPLLGSLKVGHFKEPFSLEELTSSKYITFTERSLPIIFAPSRNTGIGFHNHAADQRVTYAAGIFRDVDGYGEGEGSDLNYTARFTALPWKADKNKLIHLGLSYSVRDFTSARFRARPDVHIGPRFVDTGDFDADGANLLALEMAGVFSLFSVQGEWLQADVDSAEMGDPNFSGYYVMASVFLTGEHRSYSGKKGSFGRVKPKSNFLKDGGPGAWELAVRYSCLDLNDAEATGGELSSVTAGVNWYLNPNTRFMLDYIKADLDGVGDSTMMTIRFQVDF